MRPLIAVEDSTEDSIVFISKFRGHINQIIQDNKFSLYRNLKNDKKK